MTANDGFECWASIKRSGHTYKIIKDDAGDPVHACWPRSEFSPSTIARCILGRGNRLFRRHQSAGRTALMFRDSGNQRVLLVWPIDDRWVFSIFDLDPIEPPPTAEALSRAILGGPGRRGG